MIKEEVSIFIHGIVEESTSLLNEYKTMLNPEIQDNHKSQDSNKNQDTKGNTEISKFPAITHQHDNSSSHKKNIAPDDRKYPENLRYIYLTDHQILKYTKDGQAITWKSIRNEFDKTARFFAVDYQPQVDMQNYHLLADGYVTQIPDFNIEDPIIHDQVFSNYDKKLCKKNVSIEFSRQVILFCFKNFTKFYANPSYLTVHRLACTMRNLLAICWQSFDNIMNHPKKNAKDYLALDTFLSWYHISVRDILYWEDLDNPIIGKPFNGNVHPSESNNTAGITRSAFMLSTFLATESNIPQETKHARIYRAIILLLNILDGYISTRWLSGHYIEHSIVSVILANIYDKIGNLKYKNLSRNWEIKIAIAYSSIPFDKIKDSSRIVQFDDRLTDTMRDIYYECVAKRHFDLAHLSLISNHTNNKKRMLTAFASSIENIMQIKNITKRIIDQYHAIFSDMDNLIGNDVGHNFRLFAQQCFENKPMTEDKLILFFGIFDELKQLPENDYGDIYVKLALQFIEIIKSGQCKKQLPKSFVKLSQLNIDKYLSQVITLSPPQNQENTVVVSESENKENQTAAALNKSSQISKDQQEIIDEPQLVHLRQITKLLFQNEWQPVRLKIWQINLIFKEKTVLFYDVLQALKNNDKYKHLVKITINHDDFLQRLQDKFVAMLINLWKANNIKLIDNLISIDFSSCYVKEGKIKSSYELLLTFIYEMSVEYQAEALQLKRKEILDKYQRIRVEFECLLRNLNELLTQHDPLCIDSNFKVVERARNRLENTEGEYFNSAKKVVGLSKEVNRLFINYEKQFKEINLAFVHLSVAIAEFSLQNLLEITTQQCTVLAELVRSLEESKLRAYSLESKFKDEYENPVLNLDNAIQNFIELFKHIPEQVTQQNTSPLIEDDDEDNEETQYDEIPKENAEPGKQINSSSFSTPPKLTDAESIAVSVSASLTPLQVVVHNPNLTADLKIKQTNRHLLFAKLNQGQSPFYEARLLSNQPSQLPSTLSNEQLLSKLKIYKTNIDNQWQQNDDAIEENTQLENVKARYNISFNLFSFYHGVWLILIKLEPPKSMISPEQKTIYSKLRRAVRDIRSILIKSPKNYSVKDLYHSTTSLLSDYCLGLIDGIAKTDPVAGMPIEAMKKLTEVICYTEVYISLKKSSGVKQQINVEHEQTTKQKNSAHFCLLQIAEALTILKLLANTSVRHPAQLYANPYGLSVLKMCICIIGAYAAQLDTYYPETFNKLQQDIKDEYFSRVIGCGTLLRHPLHEDKEVVDIFKLYGFLVRTDSEEFSRLIKQLLENPGLYITSDLDQGIPLPINTPAI